MMALVSSDELAKDVTGAEALLERHQVGCSFNICLCRLYRHKLSGNFIRF